MNYCGHFYVTYRRLIFCQWTFFFILYADDQVLFTTTPESLQHLLNDVQNYCDTFSLKININKTKVMIFEKGRPTTYDFFLYDKKLEVVSSFKYLGIYFFKNGDWHRTQKCITEHASKALYRPFSIFNQYEFKFKFFKFFITLSTWGL